MCYFIVYIFLLILSNFGH